MTTSSSKQTLILTASLAAKKLKKSSCIPAFLRISWRIFGSCFRSSLLFFFTLPVVIGTLITSSVVFVRALADTRQMGKLSREQFSLAMHLIQLKVCKGMDPPQALTPDMIPPSERGTPGPVSHVSTFITTRLNSSWGSAADWKVVGLNPRGSPVPEKIHVMSVLWYNI